MVTPAVSDWLPQPGDEVTVAWGLGSVRGRVLEAYATGLHPRVVVELVPGEAAEEAATVTVPLGAVQPVDADSPWATYLNYERAVQHAIERILGPSIETISSNRPFGTSDVDLWVQLKDGRSVIVDVKLGSPWPSRSQLDRYARRLRQHVAGNDRLVALLVTNAPLARGFSSTARPSVGVLTWRDERDDAGLEEELERLLG